MEASRARSSSTRSLGSATRSLSSSGSRKRKEHSDTSQPTSSSSKSRKTNKTSVYDPAFQNHLQDHGVFLRAHYQTVPENIAPLKDLLAEPRPSLSPSRFTDADYEAFIQDNEEAMTEAYVQRSMFPRLLGSQKVPSSAGVDFSNLRPLTDGSITRYRPDYYEGSRPAELRKKIRKDFGEHIIPSTDDSRPCLPNFFAELKGPNGNAAVVKRQACYNGAIGARAMHELRAQVDEDSALDNNAYTITSTLSAGSGGAFLTLYTTHPTASQSNDRAFDYRMTQVDGWHMTGNIESFRRGTTAIRNAREWAQQQRTELIDSANSSVSAAATAVAQSLSSPSQASNSESNVEPQQLADSQGSADTLPSDSSIDELAADTGRSFKSSRTTVYS